MAAEQLPEHMDFQRFAWMHHMAAAISTAPANLTAHTHKQTERAD